MKKKGKSAKEALNDAKEKWTYLTQNTSDFIIFTDIKGVVKYINKTIPPDTPEQVIGTKIFDYLPQHDDIAKKTFEKVIKTGNSNSYENVFERGGRSVWASTKIIPIKRGNEIHYMMMFVSDITKQKKYELGLKNSKKQIEKEVERKTKELKDAHEKIRDYAEKLSHKIKRIDEKRIPLTKNEKLAFYGLVRYPDLTGREVADKMNMQRATVNSIKKRLKKEGYFKTMHIPRLDMFGCDLLSVNYSVKNIEVNDEESLMASIKEGVYKKIISIPERSYCVFSGKEGFSISISRNLSAYQDIQDSIESENQKKGIILDSYKTINFPLDKSVFNDYFNFATILKNRFELDVEDSGEPEPKYKKHELSLSEKKLIYALMEHPDYTVAQLSKKVGISVPTLCKLRRKLLQNGLIKVVNLPDFKKIGMELIVLSHHKFMPTKIPGEQFKTNNFLSVITKSECVGVALYKNYTEARNYMKECPILRNTKPTEKPMHVIIPLESVKFSKLEFKPLVKKLFGLDI
jgi:PAS domain S-box-containing protein